MDVYLARFSGAYLPGEMIITDRTRQEAYERVKDKIDQLGFADKNKSFSIVNLELINTDIKQIIIIDDGDY